MHASVCLFSCSQAQISKGREIETWFPGSSKERSKIYLRNTEERVTNKKSGGRWTLLRSTWAQACLQKNITAWLYDIGVRQGSEHKENQYFQGYNVFEKKDIHIFKGKRD